LQGDPSEQVRDQDRRCPRCESAILVDGQGTFSRVARGEGADVEVCSRCGEREAWREALGWPGMPLSSWPVDVEELVREERMLLTRYRRPELSMETITPENARTILGEDEEDDRA
jgi:ribosomal protein S27AE